MPKLFCVSDIHSFYDKFLEALLAAGFDRDNEDHWLICCGDYFDRGDKPEEVMEYLSGLPRKVLIRGNHEDLLEECYSRGRAYGHDVHNGTVQTILDLADCHKGDLFSSCCNRTRDRVQPFLDVLLNYFETKNYVFVHGWFPYMADNWRHASDKEWSIARWVNGMARAAAGTVDPQGKTVICGHYHTSWGHVHLEDMGCEDEYGNGDFSPYYAEGIIAIDACTAYSGQVNVVVLEDEFLEEEEL